MNPAPLLELSNSTQVPLNRRLDSFNLPFLSPYRINHGRYSAQASPRYHFGTRGQPWLLDLMGAVGLPLLMPLMFPA